MDNPALLSLLHFTDTAFPTGGYAHSFGLERYCQAGIIGDAEGVERFLLAQLEGSAGPTDATAAVAALRAISAGDLGTCRALDETRPAKDSVPLDLELAPERRMLVVSGPNAGGKTVTLRRSPFL